MRARAKEGETRLVARNGGYNAPKRLDGPPVRPSIRSPERPKDLEVLADSLSGVEVLPCDPGRRLELLARRRIRQGRIDVHPVVQGTPPPANTGSGFLEWSSRDVRDSAGELWTPDGECLSRKDANVGQRTTHISGRAKELVQAVDASDDVRTRVENDDFGASEVHGSSWMYDERGGGGRDVTVMRERRARVPVSPLSRLARSLPALFLLNHHHPLTLKWYLHPQHPTRRTSRWQPR